MATFANAGDLELAARALGAMPVPNAAGGQAIPVPPCTPLEFEDCEDLECVYACRCPRRNALRIADNTWCITYDHIRRTYKNTIAACCAGLVFALIPIPPVSIGIAGAYGGCVVFASRQFVIELDTANRVRRQAYIIAQNAFEVCMDFCGVGVYYE